MPAMLASVYNSSTTPTFREVNTVALDIIQESTISAGLAMIEISLSSLLFGVLTVLSPTAIFFLIREGSLARTNTRVLVLSTILLYASTGTYVAALVWNRSQANRLVLGATDGLYSASYDGRRDTAAFEDALWRQSWMAVIALESSCIIGDAIVWWRVCVIWRNKVVYCIGPLLVTLTLVFGFIGYHEPQIVPTAGVTFLVTNNAFIETAAVLSLATNALATALIGYKMWEHRRLVKKHLSAAGGTKSRVLNALALLIESGSVYCALLTFVVVYKERPAPFHASAAGRVFARVAECFVYGCLVPLMAMYPIVIIVLVALKRSPIDAGGLSSIGDQSPESRGSTGPDDKGRESTAVVFRHSTLRISVGWDREDVMQEVVWAGDSPQSDSMLSWRSPTATSERHAKESSGISCGAVRV